MTSNLKVSISAGNKKMGAVPSVSLPPIKTCTNCEHCAKKCYAAKLCRLRPSVRNAYDRNFEILTADPAAYWAQVKAAAVVTRYFRYHVSGDIVNPEYFKSMVSLAEELPHTEFLCFTKNYAVVNAHIAERGVESLPQNLHIIFSGWGDLLKPENPYNLPESNVIFKGEAAHENWLVCGGNCTECACRGVGCWQLKRGETIAFYEH